MKALISLPVGVRDQGRRMEHAPPRPDDRDVSTEQLARRTENGRNSIMNGSTCLI
jgi:hypothetical protein